MLVAELQNEHVTADTDTHRDLMSAGLDTTGGVSAGDEVEDLGVRH